MNKKSELKSIRISKLPAAVLFATVLSLFLSGAATAGSTVTVDGIKTAGEYTGANSGEKSLLWWNGHHSADYTKADGNMNPLVWEINEISSDNFSLNVFFEVPTYARRMIWAKDCNYSGGSVSGDCAPLAPGGDKAYLDAYDAGSHHDDGVKMDYGTQTGSEYFQLNGLSSSLRTQWQDEDSNGLSDNLTWATSREYLIGNGTCSTDLCTQFDMTSSIEVMWQGLASAATALGMINSITDMELHLSDEAIGLPDIPGVPVPAAFWLFGTALIGFIGMSRRTNLS